MTNNLVDHTLIAVEFKEIIYELRPCLDKTGKPVEGLSNAWIFLNNPQQYNSYTTAAVKEIILAFRQASMDRRTVAVIFSAVGDKAFCTGGNTKEYAEYYSGRPQEYKQYMRLFNDMIT
ncbi:MAG: enoyl-CoA hydratase-related protein, partial [Candidatus Neomarinimicrobiota bacterium]